MMPNLQLGRRWRWISGAGIVLGCGVGCFLNGAMGSARIESISFYALPGIFGLMGFMISYPMLRMHRDLDDARAEIRDLRAQLAAGGDKGGRTPDRPAS